MESLKFLLGLQQSLLTAAAQPPSSRLPVGAQPWWPFFASSSPSHRLQKQLKTVAISKICPATYLLFFQAPSPTYLSGDY